MSVYYEQQNSLFDEEESENSFIEMTIKVPQKHPFVVASKKLDWDALFQEIEPILYKGVNKLLGRWLNLRVHCGIYILQASHNWTDRESGRMLKFYAPARIFCGYNPKSEKSIHFSKLEKFRNRLGEKGAEIMNKYLLQTAKKYNFTDGKIMDTDTTVQDAGITYPADINLMKKLRQRILHFAKKLKMSSTSKFHEMLSLEKNAKKLENKYRFFLTGKKNIKEKKKEIIQELQKISQSFMNNLIHISKLPKAQIAKLKPALQKEIKTLETVGQTLLFQIQSWIIKGEVSKNKILSLYKKMPYFIGKGKIGKKYEIGRKIGVNQYLNGFLSVFIPQNPTIHDALTLPMSIRQSYNIFGEIPDSIGGDRIYSTKKNIKYAKRLKIQEIGLQPKGKSEWEVDRETAQKLYCRRAAIEPRIGVAGRFGLKKSRAKTDEGDMIFAQKGAIGFNFNKLLKFWQD